MDIISEDNNVGESVLMNVAHLYFSKFCFYQKFIFKKV
jgi:hypothetical protein